MHLKVFDRIFFHIIHTGYSFMYYSLIIVYFLFKRIFLAHPPFLIVFLRQFIYNLEILHEFILLY